MKWFFIVLYAALLSLGYLVIRDSTAHARDSLEVWQASSIEGHKTRMQERVLEKLSFGLYDKASAHAEEISLLKQAADRADLTSRRFAWAAVVVSVALIAAVMLKRREHLAGHLLGISAIFLLVGIAAPMLYLVAGKQLPVIGEFIAKSEAKSIVSTVTKLFGKSPFLAVLVALFSIVVPVIKLGLSFWIVAKPCEQCHLPLKFIKHIGKWSMADVFVVAVLMATLAMQSDESLRVTLGVGIYCFAAYCLLSIAAGQVIERGVKAKAGLS